MKTKAVRIHGARDLRLEEFDLPPIEDDEILAEVVSDSICMSSHKFAVQGNAHKRVREDLAARPVMIGHEFCGILREVGGKWAGKFKAGDRFAIQPALNYRGTLWAPGYSYEYIGGDATYIVIPNEVMEQDCLLPYRAEAFYLGSLSEPVSCIVGAYHAQYHTKNGSYVHEMGLRSGGSLALLAAAGPMGMGAVDYAIHCDRRPARIVATDIDQARLDRAAAIFTVGEARLHGVELLYVNTGPIPDPATALEELNGGAFDDVFVFAPVKEVVELGDRLLGPDGCLNFFAGPTRPDFSASLNFYEVHYDSHHLVGTSGGNTDDIRESLEMMADGRLNPAAMITHVGGLDAVADTTLDLDRIPGGKKLIYTHKRMPLAAIADFPELGKTETFYAGLAEICARHKGFWSAEAERWVFEKAPDI